MITTLTKTQEKLMPEYARKWIDIGLSTREPSVKRKTEIINQFRGQILRYDKGKIVFCKSPIDTWNTVRNTVRNTVWNTVENTVRNTVWNTVRNTVWNTVWNTVGNTVRNTVRNTVWNTVWNTVGNTVRNTVRNTVGNTVENTVRNTFVWPYCDGHWSSSYFSYYDYIFSVLKIKCPTDLFYVHLNTTELGLVYPFKDITFVSEKPNKIVLNSSKQLHNDGGPALSYSDGFSIYSLNGVIVSKEIAETPGEKLDPNLAIKEQNVDVRREIIRKIGIENYVKAVGAKVLDTLGDYELLSIKLSDEISDARFLKMLNPSLKVWHVEGVDPTCNTVQEAINWRAGDRNKVWVPEILT